MSRLLEVIMGALTSVLAFVGLGFLVFGPGTFSYDGSGNITTATRSLWDQGIDNANVIIFLTAMIVAALAIGVGTYLRSRDGHGTALSLMWGGFLVLLVGSVITLPGNTTAVVPSVLHTDTADSVGVGIYLVPAVVAAFVDAFIETVAHHKPSAPIVMKPR